MITWSGVVETECKGMKEAFWWKGNSESGWQYSLNCKLKYMHMIV